jgi:hypothetical protein
MSKTITSANSVFMLAIANLFAAPQQLQGYATEDIFDTESIAPAETHMGLDGKLSAGYIPVPVKQTITLQADSDSVELFEAWFAAQTAAQEIYFAHAIVHLPSIGRSYVCTNGVLDGYSPMADAKKTLQPRKFSILWESVVGAPV